MFVFVDNLTAKELADGHRQMESCKNNRMNSKIFVLLSSFVLLAWLGLSFVHVIAPSTELPAANASFSKDDSTFAGNPSVNKP